MFKATMKLNLGKLKTLSEKLQRKSMRIAMNRAASPVKQAVITQAPKKTGALAKSIRIKVKNLKTQNVWIAVIGPKRGYSYKKQKPARYAYPLETGSKKMPAHKFLEPAFQITKEQFIDRFTETIAREVKSHCS